MELGSRGSRAPIVARPVLGIGLVAVALAVVLGLVLVQRVGTTYRDGLDVAAESAALAADSAEPIAAITTELVTFADAAATGLADARQLLGTAQTSLDQLGVAARDDLAVTADGLARLADRVAGVIESIERIIPGNRESAAEDLRAIADGLEPVPGELRSLGDQLQATAEQLGDLDPTLAEVAASVRGLGSALDALAPSVDTLAVTATRLSERVDDARDRVGLDLWLSRLVVVLVGGVMAIGLVLTGRRSV